MNHVIPNLGDVADENKRNKKNQNRKDIENSFHYNGTECFAYCPVFFFSENPGPYHFTHSERQDIVRHVTYTDRCPEWIHPDRSEIGEEKTPSVSPDN